MAALAAPLLFASGPAEARVIGRSTEISVGREAASSVEQFYPVDTDPVAVARVRQIGRRLAACAKDPDFPFEFHVVEDAEVNAFALPGGFIYVFRGLLQLVPNDDALASVLAHEISHVTRRHAINQFEKNVILSAAITGILAGTGVGGGYRSAADVVQLLASLSFTRHDEADADRHGIELLAAAGYDPRAAVEAMRLVKRAAGDGKGIPALLRTHPAPDSRIKKLGQMADELVARRPSTPPQMGSVPTPPAPARLKLSGLEGVAIGACDWFPLAPGARWAYRIKDGEAETRLMVRVLDEVIAEPAGVFRVEHDYGRAIKTLCLVAPARDRYLIRAEKAGASTPWRLEALFAEPPGDSEISQPLRCAGKETIRVPAGEFEAVKTERLGPDGRIEAVLWHTPGVGLVKRLSTSTGAVQELTAYYLPKTGSGTDSKEE
jgi:Zn-dependent protease with chaperone function